MVKRKAAKKIEEKKKVVPKAKVVSNDMPVPAMLLKVLAAFLSVILVIALTLYYAWLKCSFHNLIPVENGVNLTQTQTTHKKEREF